jgi:hypothetical protein
VNRAHAAEKPFMAQFAGIGEHAIDPQDELRDTESLTDLRE